MPDILHHAWLPATIAQQIASSDCSSTYHVLAPQAAACPSLHSEEICNLVLRCSCVAGMPSHNTSQSSLLQVRQEAPVSAELPVSQVCYFCIAQNSL